jgi:hypothetical protein
VSMTDRISFLAPARTATGRNLAGTGRREGVIAMNIKPDGTGFVCELHVSERPRKANRLPNCSSCGGASGGPSRVQRFQATAHAARSTRSRDKETRQQLGSECQASRAGAMPKPDRYNADLKRLEKRCARGVKRPAREVTT